MADGELAAVFRALAKDAAQTAENIAKSVAKITEETANITESNAAKLLESDAKAAERITSAGRKGATDAAGNPVRTDSRGRVIPPGVERLPSGRLPSNFEYAGRVYDGEKWTPKLAEKYPNGVRFTDDGFPDFSPYASHTVTFDPQFKGNHGSDFVEANRLAGLPETPEGYTWHHTQDARTMQLVPSDLHDAIRHAGGVAIMKGRN
jgi:hypothetical protein